LNVAFSTFFLTPPEAGELLTPIDERRGLRTRCQSEGAGGHSGGSFRSPPTPPAALGAREVNKARAQAEGEAGGRRGGEVEEIKRQKNVLNGKGIVLNYNNRVFISIFYLGCNSEVSAFSV
jgi:hypothetical protein